MIVCVANIGSTSLKTKIIEIDDGGNQRVVGEANLDRVREPVASTLVAKSANAGETSEVGIVGYGEAMKCVLDWYARNGVLRSPADLDCVGFKCVMGRTNGANRLTPEILSEMEEFRFVAPVHNGPYLEAIRDMEKAVSAPLIGVFEPSFHWSIPEYRRSLGLPEEWSSLGIAKFGFHGASHRYLSAAAYAFAEREDLRLITLHLGGSSSVCAHVDGRSFDIDQDFSPNSGLPQGTRTGKVDGGALLYGMKRLGLGADEAQDAISNRGGLKGMAGLGTDDLKTILDGAAKGNRRAALTIERYVDDIRKSIGSFVAVMGGLDAVVVGGGIGENSPEIRRGVFSGLQCFGIELDEEQNAAKSLGRVSAADSRVPVDVVATDEAEVVAHFAARVVQLGRDLQPREMVFRLPPDRRLPGR